MSEKIEPALSAEEWAVFQEAAHERGESLADYLDSSQVYPAKSIARANASLPDSDERKITRETLAALEEVVGAAALWNAEQHKAGRDMKPGDHALERVAVLYRGLASYLPPESA